MQPGAVKGLVGESDNFLKKKQWVLKKPLGVGVKIFGNKMIRFFPSYSCSPKNPASGIILSRFPLCWTVWFYWKVYHKVFLQSRCVISSIWLKPCLCDRKPREG